ncbi:Hsp20/alpha crystallin family protein [Candidatus Poribacteria bacterium]|nr:Hsp20/alpha crystallin family protein [Candidatus Poribacteria bacterium]
MAIVRHRGAREFEPFTNFFDFPELFTDRSVDFPLGFGGRRLLDMPTVWHPTADVFEDDNYFYVRMDLPGMTKDQIALSFDGHILSVTGNRGEGQYGDDTCYWSRERYTGEFHRYVHVPGEVNSENLMAKYESGVLEVALPKTEKAKRLKIAIESGEN